MTVHDNNQFWSSSGSPDPTSDEWLQYRLPELAVVASVSFWPFKANFQFGLPVYSPQRYSVSLGSGAAADAVAWTYRSATAAARRESTEHVRDVTAQALAAGWVRIDLMGRTETQAADSLWYTCVRLVQILGTPLPLLANVAPTLTRALVRRAVFRGTVTEAELSAYVLDLASHGTDRTSSWQSRQDMRAYLLRAARDAQGAGTGPGAKDLVGAALEAAGVLGDEVAELLLGLNLESCRRYLMTVRTRRRLSQRESVVFVAAVHRATGFVLPESEYRCLTPSEELGDVFASQGDLEAALRMYGAARVLDKQIAVLVRALHFAPIVPFFQSMGGDERDWAALLGSIRRSEIVPADTLVVFAFIVLVRPGILTAAHALAALGLAAEADPAGDAVTAATAPATALEAAARAAATRVPALARMFPQ